MHSSCRRAPVKINSGLQMGAPLLSKVVNLSLGVAIIMVFPSEPRGAFLSRVPPLQPGGESLSGKPR